MRVLLALLVAQAAAAQSWSWPEGGPSRGGSSRGGSSRGGSSGGSGSGGRQRYEVFETDGNDFTLPHPEDLGGGNRPLPRPPPPRPPQQGPNYPLVNPNPAYRPPVINNRPPRPPLPPVSDLHGPSKCKCTQPFNCEANSLQFGSCDAGKQYCCTKEHRGPRGPGGPGGRPGVGVGGAGPAVLVGPGGPIGGAPSKYSDGSSGYGGGYAVGSGLASGVLAGPRPAHYRPDPAAGFSSPSRPGYRPPSSGPYRDYDNYNRRGGFGLNR